MKPTRKQQAQIRAYWPWYTLRFCSDGRVTAKPSRTGSPYALLYTARDTAVHVAASQRTSRP